MTRIDAHMHYGDRHPAFLALLEELDLKFLNICVATDELGDWHEQAERYCTLTAEMPDRFGWCTTFELPTFDDSNYVDKVIQRLAQDFASGAVACKIWKNIGMEVRTPTGEFFMVDDPLFDPILDYIANSDRTLLTHIAEPYACWQPLRPEDPHYGYYSKNPQWHMYGKPEYPSHERLMEARDAMIAKHPDLRVVGAHLGSLEYDVDEVAARFRRFPNFAIDVSARLADMAWQDASKVRKFFLDFPDRIIFGTDVVMIRSLSSFSEAELEQALASLRANFESYFAYFESSGKVMVRGREVQGLGLPESVLERFYVTNAQEWYPGL